eukprot:1149578-Pelagomonas_calceolata.AAC.4
MASIIWPEHAGKRKASHECNLHHLREKVQYFRPRTKWGLVTPGVALAGGGREGGAAAARGMGGKEALKH